MSNVTVTHNGVSHIHETSGLVFGKADMSAGTTRREIMYYDAMSNDDIGQRDAMIAGLLGTNIFDVYYYSLFRFGEIVNAQFNYCPVAVVKKRVINKTASRADKRRMKQLCALLNIEYEALALHPSEM